MRRRNGDLPRVRFALVIGPLMVTGLAPFFMPLLSIHERMTNQKERLRQSVFA